MGIGKISNKVKNSSLFSFLCFRSQTGSYWSATTSSCTQVWLVATSIAKSQGLRCRHWRSFDTGDFYDASFHDDDDIVDDSHHSYQPVDDDELASNKGIAQDDSFHCAGDDELASNKDIAQDDSFHCPDDDEPESNKGILHGNHLLCIQFHGQCDHASLHYGDDILPFLRDVRHVENSESFLHVGGNIQSIHPCSRFPSCSSFLFLSGGIHGLKTCNKI